jgi:hypothetical protein
MPVIPGSVQADLEKVRPYLQNNHSKEDLRCVQVLECLPIKQEALRLNSSATERKKK